MAGKITVEKPLLGETLQLMRSGDRVVVAFATEAGGWVVSVHNTDYELEMSAGVRAPRHESPADLMGFNQDVRDFLIALGVERM